jgi:hypothetical protein
VKHGCQMRVEDAFAAPVELPHPMQHLTHISLLSQAHSA